MRIPLCRLFAFAVVALAIPAAIAFALNAGGDEEAACVEGTIRINDNGSPQICVKR